MTKLHGGPRRLIAVAEERFLSGDACKDLLARAAKLSRGGGDVEMSIRSRWTGNVRWARNEISSSGDTTDHFIEITRVVRGAAGSASTSRTDEASLENCIRRAEERMRYSTPNDDATPIRRAETYLKPELWSDATFALDAAARAQIQKELVGPAVAEQLLSAGYLEVAAIGNGVINTAGLFAYVPETRAEYSVTVRNARGTGSGWAGVAAKDWRTIDAQRISATALDKCKRSADPVAVEPGRYTMILEPQAVSDLMLPLMWSLSRPPAEEGMGPWADGARVPTPLQYPGGPPLEGVIPGGAIGVSKIGKRVLDPRITISADPTDPDIPYVPFAWDSTPMRPVKWIENGVLKELSYPRFYAVAELNKPDPLNNNYAFRMSGGTTSTDEMIKTTERGLLITRLVNVRTVDYPSLLQTGTTSDGVWLIERGAITKAVKNFRFRDSPLFAFNNVDVMGPPVRVFQSRPTIVPAVRVRDFSLTSLADAV
jgi:predicted Zn-dependent protease